MDIIDIIDKFVLPFLFLLIAMPPIPRRRAEMGLRRRKPKRQATANERWLHLGAGEASLMFTLHVVMGTASLFCSAMHQLLALSRGLPWPSARSEGNRRITL